MERERVVADLVLHAHLRRVDDAEREVAGLELGEAAVGHVHRARQAEGLAVEADGAVEVLRQLGDEVDAGDEPGGVGRGHGPTLRLAPPGVLDEGDPRQPRGTTKPAIATKCAAAAAMTSRWKSSWKPKTAGRGSGRRSM